MFFSQKIAFLRNMVNNMVRMVVIIVVSGTTVKTIQIQQSTQENCLDTLLVHSVLEKSLLYTLSILSTEKLPTECLFSSE